MLFPMVPRMALRIQPIKYVAIKAEFAFGVVQMFVGASLHVNFGFAKSSPEAAPPPKPAEPAPAVVLMGRVLGSVIDDDTKTPVTGAIVQRTAGGAVSTLTTDASGRFVVDKLDPGLAHFDLQHPDYQPASCEAQIPANGGDVPLMCHLHPIAPTGAISGQIQDEKGGPIATEGIELSGPSPQKLKSDAHGLFAAVDLPAGAYRLNVDADGYLAQNVEVKVEAHQTAMPQVTLVKKPKKVLVELRKEEIVITQQIQFKLGSAEILGESSNVLRQVADVLLRNPQINQLEIQGHTDNKGSHDMNMKLSQERAESVRNWLVQAGVPGDHLQAVGYGPDNPIRPNNNAANRALNRRVQFIIHAQGGAQP
jgi:outer membrane protein OmpA-like peptidoglycan-associated protein